MDAQELIGLLLIAGLPALISPVGGLLALFHRPSTLFSSVVFGFAGGAVLATVAIEMLPRGIEQAGLAATVVVFLLGFAVVYAFDLIVHRGVVAGEHAEQRRRVEMAYRRRPPRGGTALVLAGMTSLDEVIEGLTIGISLALAPGLAFVVALAIFVDNLSEGMAIGELFREEAGGDARRARRPAVLWTATVGLSLFISATFAWLLLRDVGSDVQGVLVAAAAGGLLYLTLTDLLPEAQQRQFQQSAALAASAAFALILVVSTLARGG